VTPSGKRTGPVAFVLMFLAGLTATSLMVGILFPFRQDFFVRTKFVELQASSTPYDLLFLGPSTTYNHINAELFEQRLKASDHAVHVFNFGTPAMQLCEADSIVRHLLVMDDLDIKWIFFDLDLANIAHKQNPLSRRFIAWHDLPGLVCDIRTTISTDLPVGEQLTRLYNGIRAFAYRSSNAGTLAEIIKDRVIAPALTDEEEKYLDFGKQGFLAIDYGVPYTPRRNQSYLIGLSQYQQRREHTAADSNEYDNFRRFVQGFVYQKKMVDRLAARSIQSAFFVSPDLNRDDAYLGAIAHETGRVVFAFNDINAYPRLYRVDYRFGLHHLNGSGANLLTGLLAEQFSRYLDTTSR
jgi:hypothetical protein